MPLSRYQKLLWHMLNTPYPLDNLRLFVPAGTRAIHFLLAAEIAAVEIYRLAAILLGYLSGRIQWSRFG